ncbi:MAG: sigma-70 family RNA polymerase sigma factor [Gammaproteobacteria bacterium]|nr:sigma-70 family RNA polymerase sigma factor [Gammaproteobacteria bacterium]
MVDSSAKISQLDERELLKRAKEGDESAFNVIYKKYEHRLLKHIRHWTDTEDDALDVLMQTFAKIWKNLPNFRGDSQFFTWAYKIARSESSNYRSYLKRRPLGNLIEAEEDQTIEEMIENRTDKTSPYEAKIGERVSKEEYDAAVEDLPPDLKDAFVLSQEKYKYCQIAAMLDTPAGTVRSRISRARDAICLKLFGKSRTAVLAEWKKTNG